MPCPVQGSLSSTRGVLFFGYTVGYVPTCMLFRPGKGWSLCLFTPLGTFWQLETTVAQLSMALFFTVN